MIRWILSFFRRALTDSVLNKTMTTGRKSVKGHWRPIVQCAGCGKVAAVLESATYNPKEIDLYNWNSFKNNEDHRQCKFCGNNLTTKCPPKMNGGSYLSGGQIAKGRCLDYRFWQRWGAIRWEVRHQDVTVIEEN